MHNNLSKYLINLATGLILLVSAACSAQASPTATASLTAPTQTIQATETKPEVTVTRTRRVKATNTPLGGRPLPTVTLAQQFNVTTAAPIATYSGQLPTATKTPLGYITSTRPPSTSTPLTSDTSDFSETPSPTGPSLTPTITPTSTPIQNTGPIDLTDGLGRAVHLSNQAMKVVSLSPASTEILYAVGAWTQVVGRDDYSDFPDGVHDLLPSVGGTNGNFDVNAIVNLHPDLVLMDGFNDQSLVPTLVSHSLTVFYLANPANLDGMYANMLLVAKLTSHVQEESALVNTYKQRMDTLQILLAPATNRPKVFIELDGSDPANPWTCGPGSFLDTMITLAGGQNIGAVLTSPWGKMSTAQIAAQNPDIIVLTDSKYGMTAASVSARPGWANIRAVLDDNIIPVNDDSQLSRPGPRMLDGIESLAETIIHPELFP